MTKFHFVSGLPRSGSTLLAAILRQNPRFHASMSSPVASLFEGIIAQVSAGSELSTMVTPEQRAAILKGLFESYYGDLDQDIIFDTNRAWTAQLPALMHLFPDARLICTVRDVAWVLDSLERQYRSNAFENTRLFNTPMERATVYTRVDALASSNRLVGFSYQALREACWSEFADRLVMVDYDLLSAAPSQVMRLLYQFLDEPEFAHDFNNVEYDAPEFDVQLGLSGLHRVRRKVEPRRRRTILPPDLFERYANMSFWRDLKNSSAFRITTQPQDAASDDESSDVAKEGCDDEEVEANDV
ncbi:sulfotransferase [Hoeflea sp. WL0058]|uniref:Sulfotransferase n=1 Tax=Flavimaribacter sediminis TaxID=2865987 RepID=A0AAE2ZTJ0_9HYPH|nr:sulfotransferase [Flavimaribacter sediminis]MBW8640300.1 sulfotransferase [Flavimaribacter sediminis]